MTSLPYMQLLRKSCALAFTAAIGNRVGARARPTSPRGIPYLDLRSCVKLANTHHRTIERDCATTVRQLKKSNKKH